MEIIGMWKVSEAAVFDREFNRKWMTAAEIMADADVSPMQKIFAQAAYKFEEDGTVYNLMPKAAVPAGEAEPFDDEYVIAKKTQWKQENGSFFIAAEENGELDWQEMTPTETGFEVFGYQRIAKA